MAKRKRNNTLIIVLAVVIIALIALVVWKQKSKPKGEKVSVEKVETRTIKEMVSASGKIFPQTEVKISSDVSGEIVELHIEEGDSVVMGQILAKIDPDAYQSQVERGVATVNSAKAQMANSKAQIESFKAQKEQIEAQLENAKAIHTRNEQLSKDGVISDVDFETSLTNLRSLEANLRSSEASLRSSEQSAKAAEFSVKSSEATLKELRTSLRRTSIFAPTSGIVSKLDVEKGERVVGTMQMSGTEMMRIANLNAMEVQVEVSENDIPRVSLNDDVEIEVDAYLDRKFMGKVFQVAHSASGTGAIASLTSDQVTNFVVTINVDPASYADLVTPTKPYPFRPGMSASVEINTESLENVISVPIQSVTTREDDKKKKDDKEAEKEEVDDDEIKEIVFVIPAEADTVKQVEIKTGIQDDTYIQVLEGLEEGAEIVVGPYTAISRKLKEGAQIIKVDEEDLFKKKD
ncbi:MAG: biotin/lipoyl-binding protein [Bacteroidetes bacterium]|nr:biotin/lipoyl-binding protein [Bacteroidota bacterium]